MNHTRIFLVATCLATLIGCQKEPVDSLLDHAEHIDAILAQHTAQPSQGIMAARTYYREHLPSILSEIGVILAALDRIDDPIDRGEQAQDILDQLKAGMTRSMPHASEFAYALSKDPEARALLRQIGSRWTEAGQIVRGAIDLSY